MFISQVSLAEDGQDALGEPNAHSSSDDETALNIMVDAWRKCLKPYFARHLGRVLMDMVAGVESDASGALSGALVNVVGKRCEVSDSADWERWPDVGGMKHNKLPLWVKLAHVFLRGNTALFPKGCKKSNKIKPGKWTDAAFLDLLRLLPGGVEHAEVLRQVMSVDSNMGVLES